MDKLLKQNLKAQAHHLKPTILLGSKGLHPSLLEETKLVLDKHELIKVKVAVEDRDDRMHLINEICQQCGADLIQTIGSIAVIYRKNEQVPAKKTSGKNRSSRH